MSANAAQAEQLIKTCCQKAGISEQGKNWFDIAIDPFKDLRVPNSGYPDAVAIPSVVQCIHDSIEVSAPPSAGSGNWDANIFIDQIYTATFMQQTNCYPQNGFPTVFGFSGQGSQNFQRGGLVVRSGPSGTPLDITQTTSGLSFKNDVLDEGDVRVIAIGMEIHNTTPPILASGSLITYRVPDAPIVDTVGTNVDDVFGNTACVPTSNPLITLLEPPISAAEAIDLEGSVQWNAKEGCYIVPILSEPVNQPGSPEPMGLLTTIPGNDAQCYFPSITEIGSAKLCSNNNYNKLIPFSLSGAYLTGLDNETTLTVNITYYVEIFPSKKSTLRRCMQPATGLDSKALELYNNIANKLPTGVKVKDNFIGAFISGVSKLVAGAVKWLPRVIGGISAGITAYDTIQSLNVMGLPEPRPPGGRKNTMSSQQAFANAYATKKNFIDTKERIAKYNLEMDKKKLENDIKKMNRDKAEFMRLEFEKAKAPIMPPLPQIPKPKAKLIPTGTYTKDGREIFKRAVGNVVIKNNQQGRAGNRWVGK